MSKKCVHWVFTKCRKFIEPFYLFYYCFTLELQCFSYLLHFPFSSLIFSSLFLLLLPPSSPIHHHHHIKQLKVDSPKYYVKINLFNNLLWWTVQFQMLYLSSIAFLASPPSFPEAASFPFTALKAPDQMSAQCWINCVSTTVLR